MSGLLMHGSLRRQGISSHAMDLIDPEYSGLFISGPFY